VDGGIYHKFTLFERQIYFDFYKWKVGHVNADTQKLQIKDLQEGHQYSVRVMARNEVGLSDPLESEEPIRVIRPPGKILL